MYVRTYVCMYTYNYANNMQIYLPVLSVINTTFRGCHGDCNGKQIHVSVKWLLCMYIRSRYTSIKTYYTYVSAIRMYCIAGM